ncbi:hypothetical protein MTR67_022245 [Solanum verrucosum]|uniref:Uncharacterized protein n=1 Tax=Solanum verrucosum TaxID=315347 RepID=A0AAF0QXI1_SOLVR|nr:hypothetical protein MTR67_022245 [Solanum verrucosum]
MWEEIDNVLDVAYQNDVAIVQQQVDVELETTLQHPQHILEEVFDDEILNVEEEIYENEKNESFDDEKWDDNVNETTEEEEWENDRIETRSISSALERISHDTYILAVSFGTVDPRQYYPNYRRPVGASSTSQALPSLSAMRIRDSSSEQSDTMADTPPLTQRYVHPDVSPSATATPSATPNEMPHLVPGQKGRLGRVMIEPDGSSWHPANDVVRALKDCVRRLYTQAHHSWSEIPNSIRQTMFNNFKTMCTWEPRHNHVITTTFERKASARLSAWLKKVRDTVERPDWMLHHVFDELGLYWNTDKFKAISDQANKARGSLKGGSLHTGESERRRVVEQESMSATVQQIKQQAMNLTRRPTTSAPNDTDDDSTDDEDDCVEPTP